MFHGRSNWVVVLDETTDSHGNHQPDDEWPAEELSLFTCWCGFTATSVAEERHEPTQDTKILDPLPLGGGVWRAGLNSGSVDSGTNMGWDVWGP